MAKVTITRTDDAVYPSGEISVNRGVLMSQAVLNQTFGKEPYWTFDTEAGDCLTADSLRAIADKLDELSTENSDG